MRVHAEGLFATLQRPAVSERYLLWRGPAAGPCRALVVHVHAFAEEMNKCRRMAALQAQALAEAGCGVLQMDLLGCGDSAGELSDASWMAWLDDVHDACTLALARARDIAPTAPMPELWLWGVRAGALLASAALQRRAEPWNLLLWQPQATGRQVLQQFLRLRAAAALTEADPKAVLAEARAQLAAGQAVEVAGYLMPAPLAHGLEGAELLPPPAGRRVCWLETSAREAAALLPASAAVIERWRAAGVQVQAEAVRGPGFWSTVEIEDAPALVDATTRALLSAVSA